MELGDNLTNSRESNNVNKINTSQTDESKVAEQQTRLQQTSKPKVPCVADTGK